MPDESRNEELVRAVHAITAALVELRADPTAGSVRTSIDLAEQALLPLRRDLTTIVLARLLDTIDACHQGGHADSSTLASRERSTVRALRLDPRWNPRTDPLRNAS